jgi:hypothetical protein
MRIVAPLAWYLVSWLLCTAILYIGFGLYTTLFSLENCLFFGWLLASLAMVLGADRESIYEWIEDHILDKLARR